MFTARYVLHLYIFILKFNFQSLKGFFQLKYTVDQLSMAPQLCKAAKCKVSKWTHCVM